jgi:hypothetical protein
MAIARKPRGPVPASPSNEREIERLILKGGSVADAKDKPDCVPATANVVLRIPADLLERVDREVEGRRPRIPRHTWLLEAIVEKLERATSK